jgi:hypothetical protein
MIMPVFICCLYTCNPVLSCGGDSSHCLKLYFIFVSVGSKGNWIGLECVCIGADEIYCSVVHSDKYVGIPEFHICCPDFQDRMTDSFFRTGDFFAESGVEKIEGYRLPRRYYSLINTVAWGCVVLVPMVYYLLRLLTSGSTVYVCIGISTIGICKYIFWTNNCFDGPSLLWAVSSITGKPDSYW